MYFRRGGADPPIMSAKALSHLGKGHIHTHM